MATSAIFEDADAIQEDAPTRKPTRVAQLGAKLKSVAIITDKSKPGARQKRPAPALPAEAKRVGERPQELNTYAANKARGEPTKYLDLVRSLGELRAVGEKGHKQLLDRVLPRLAQHELPPASLVPQLIQLAAASDDRRLIRFVHHLLQLVLGVGSAGTPSPGAGEASLAIACLPADISSRSWAGVLQPETPAPLADLQLRTLSAASRVAEAGRLAKPLAEAVHAVLDRAEAGAGLGSGTGRASKAQRKEQIDAWEMHWSALLAARSALAGRPLSNLAVRSSLGIVSPEGVGARHALALLTGAMRENAAAVFKEDKDLAGLLAATAAAYEASTSGTGADKKAGIDRRRAVNLVDRWGRVELARLCAAAVYADWTSTQDFVSRVGASFWRMLLLLAARDREDLVALEAVRCLFGSLPAALGVQKPAEDARNAKLRARAWILVSAHAGTPADSAEGGEEGLLAAIRRRLEECLAPGRPVPLRCTACRTAGEILETAQRFGSQRSRVAKESSALQKMVLEVGSLVRAVAHGDGPPPVRCAATEALLWTQASSQLPVVSPTGLGRHIQKSAWTKSLLQALFRRIHQVLRAFPAAAQQLLQIARAAASAAAAAIEPDQLLELWSLVMKLPEGRAAALSAALSLLSSPTPGAPLSGTGASAERLARAAAHEAGWLELLRNTAWWLGENANLACNEFAGSPPPAEERNENEAPQAETTPLETAALQAFRNPRMAAVVSRLQHAALTLPSGPRTAAVQALAKVAVRSEEPYRLQCYAVLASLDTSRASAAPDAHGVACAVQHVLPILDMLYSSRLVLEQLAEEFGRLPHRWPPAVVAQLRQRNTLLEQRVQRAVCSLSGASYFPLGPLSRDLLTSGIDSLAPQLSLVQQSLPELRTAVSASSQDTLQSPLAGTARHSRANSVLSTEGANPLLSGPDPLAALTENLNQHITAEAFKPRAPAPWELNALQPPSTIFEETAEDEDSPRPASQEAAAAGESVHYLRGSGVAVHSFEAEMSDELTVRNGEEVDIEAEVDGWLHCINRYGIKGLVPASYIRMLGPDEGPVDVAAQLFGGGPLQQRQREKSVDLLNQPDMLAALLGAAPDGDDWGAAPSLYDTRVQETPYLDAGLGPPPVGADGVDGDMAIPELVSWAEQEGWDEQEEEQDGTEAVPVQGLEDQEDPPPMLEDSSAIPEAPDNPFENSVEEEAEAAVAAVQSISEAGSSEIKFGGLESVTLPPKPIATARLASALSTSQPLSARVEHESEAGTPTRSSSQRSMDLVFGVARTSSLTSAASVNQQPLPAAALLPAEQTSFRRLSRQASREASGQPLLARQSSEVSAQLRHMRQASHESAGAGPTARHSRQNSMDQALMTIKAAVLYEFVAETEDELSVAPGDAIVIQAEVDGWYQVTRTFDGQRGLIPASYAAPL